jgi:hypothetical protein
MTNGDDYGQDGVGIRLARVYDLACTACAKTPVTHIRCGLSASGLAVDVFWTDIFH